MNVTLFVQVATALLVLWWMGLLLAGGVLLWRRQRAGIVLLVVGAGMFATHAALAFVPVGIGEPLIRIKPSSFVAWSVAGALLGLLVAFFGLNRNPIKRVLQWRAGWMGFALLTVLAGSGALAGLSWLSTPERERERNANRRPIEMAQGFTAHIYADAAGKMDNPTTMTFAPDGKLYVADIAGTIWVCTDANGDHVIDTIDKFADGFSLLLGLVWRGNELFVSSAGKIEALQDKNRDGVADARRVIVQNLPALILNPHSNNSLTLGPDGRIYFGVGSTSDDGVEKTALGGSIISVSPDGGDMRVVARGFGNPFEIGFNSAGAMFSGDNAGLKSADGITAPDEFNQVQPGKDYGFVQNDPLASGDKTQPLINFDSHSTPTGLVFYNGQSYPAEYFDNAFVALWQNGEIKRIVPMPDSKENYTATESTFGEGFLYPIDVVVGPDGNLYIADFGTSVVYRVTYGN